MFSIKNHNKNLTIGPTFYLFFIYYYIHISVGGEISFSLPFSGKKVGNFQKFEHFLCFYFFSPSYICQGNRAGSTQWHQPSHQHFAVAFALQLPAARHLKKWLSIQSLKSYLEDTICRDFLALVVLTLSC